ncbi:Short C-terminal domain-containing protein [Clostridium acidisoli DSM 12555]|uniref:Short C-terminal domain-containing protein n=1 Tax=Clostridium acidisoli DSM 12555 TaxID=1121291 RepID=A0A1W1WZQ5_9CLOT|nr:SHOCT domain-containing protein [Clostridium acidisoli]SMC17083.1 Short C-terminal domain-containing protein [Clostridium acidisoli DSM 12555]
MGKLKQKELPKNIMESINLSNDEKVLLWLKGTNKEWLICSDKQVFIIKKGFMTGHTFGSGVFQMPYKNIAGATVNYHLLSGYFELSAGGMQNTAKSYWSNDKGSDPKQAPNCISITSKSLANEFREACTFINNKIGESSTSQTSQTPHYSNNIPEQIRKLAELKQSGILTDDEFETKKKELLDKI